MIAKQDAAAQAGGAEPRQALVGGRRERNAAKRAGNRLGSLDVGEGKVRIRAEHDAVELPVRAVGNAVDKASGISRQGVRGAGGEQQWSIERVRRVLDGIAAPGVSAVKADIEAVPA